MKISVQQIDDAAKRSEGIVLKTPLQFSKRMSEKFGANIYIKREDLQEVRSFKIRGAYNKISSLSDAKKKQGIVTASTGNHAQGVALSCALLKIKGVIFMPTVTPNQKIEKVKHFGGKWTEIKLIGDTFDEAVDASREYRDTHNIAYIHPFDDEETIAGQGTIGKEIYEQLDGKIDIVISPVGGGGIASGIASYLKQKSPKINIYGAEAEGAASMAKSLKENKVVALGTFDTFVDGAAVNTVGTLTFEICKKYLEKVVIVPVGRICKTMIDLYQSEGIIAEPAGALSIAALSSLRDEIKGKTVVCILSGGNNDFMRYPEILEKSLVYQGLKHYFLIEFAQKPGQLRKFLDDALGPTDDIVRFEYMKKTNKERGAALVGIELKKKEDLDPFLKRLEKIGINYQILSDKEMLYDYII
jgi:threonine dehydratase